MYLFSGFKLFLQKEWKINVLVFCRKPAVCGIGVEYEEAGREGHC
jgi:hypothetical protein